MRTFSEKSRLACRLLVLSVAAWSSLSLGISAAKSADQQTFEAGDVWLQGSRVFVFVGKTGFGHEHGVEGRLRSGSLGLNDSSGQLVFEMKTFTADTDTARKYVGLSGTTDAGTQTKVNANMLGSHVLDVDHFPTAEFRVTSITPLKTKSPRGLAQYQIEGQFTLHGQTRPIRFTADVEPKKNWQHLRGSFSILQTNYGMTPYSVGLGAIGVADKLTIWGDLWVAERRIVAESKK